MVFAKPVIFVIGRSIEAEDAFVADGELLKVGGCTLVAQRPVDLPALRVSGRKEYMVRLLVFSLTVTSTSPSLGAVNSGSSSTSSDIDGHVYGGGGQGRSVAVMVTM